MLIDSHAHINYENKINADKVVSEMQNDGLKAIINVGTSVEDSKKILNFATAHDDVYAIVGIHPESASDEYIKDVCEIEKIAKSDKVVAIGEIGLDYYWKSDNKEIQKKLFIAQIELAYKLDLPVCIHSRNAAEDMVEILEKYADKLKRKGVMHCYSDGPEFIKKYIDLGFYISFAGNVTFKKYDRSFLNDIPKNRILVETDCPFLSPEPLRGTINEPKNVKYTAKFLADYYNIKYEDFEKITLDNTRKVYYKLK